MSVNSHPSGPEPAGFVSLVHTEVMNYETSDYLCPNWIEGHKHCAKHRMWIKDKVCLACQLRLKK